MVGAQNTNKSVYLTNMFCLYMTCTWKMVKVSRPSNTLCKPTLVSTTSIIISPASYRVAAGGIWGQLERWLVGHREWWAHKCFKCRQVANLFTTSRRTERSKGERRSLEQYLPGHKTGGSVSSPCMNNMLHWKCHNFAMKGWARVQSIRSRVYWKVR